MPVFISEGVKLGGEDEAWSTIAWGGFIWNGLRDERWNWTWTYYC
jgi:hypothetical protein